MSVKVDWRTLRFENKCNDLSELSRTINQGDSS